jgi:hypothetical protein
MVVSISYMACIVQCALYISIDYINITFMPTTQHDGNILHLITCEWSVRWVLTRLTWLAQNIPPGMGCPHTWMNREYELVLLGYSIQNNHENGFTHLWMINSRLPFVISMKQTLGETCTCKCSKCDNEMSCNVWSLKVIVPYTHDVQLWFL